MAIEIVGMLPKDSRQQKLTNLFDLKKDLENDVPVSKELLLRLVNALIEDETLLMQLEDMAQGTLLFKNLQYPMS